MKAAPTKNIKALQPGIIGERTGSGTMNVGARAQPGRHKIAFLSERDRLSIDLYLADATTEDPAQADLDRGRSALREPAVPAVGRCVGRAEQAARDRDGQGRPAGTGDRRRRQRRHRARDQVRSVRRDLPADLVAGRQLDRVLGADRRLYRSLHLRLEPEPDQAADQRRVRGPPAGLVARRHAARIRHRPVRRRSRGARVRQLQHGVHHRRRQRDRADRDRAQRHRDQPTVVRRRQPALLRRRVERPPQPLAPRPQDEGNDAAHRRATGVAGITPLSPAISIATGTSLAAVNVFRDSGYEIRVLDPSDADRPGPTTGVADAGILPPGVRKTNTVADLLKDPKTGAARTGDVRAGQVPAEAKLLGVGQQVGVSAGSTFGTYVSGGISLMFGDVLGNHMLGVGFSVDGGVKDVAASINYLNRSSRWNWGVFGEHVPLLSGTVRSGFSNVNGQPVFVEETYLQRQTYTQTGALTAYPLSRSPAWSSAARCAGSDSATKSGRATTIRSPAASWAKRRPSCRRIRRCSSTTSRRRSFATPPPLAKPGRSWDSGCGSRPRRRLAICA